VRCGSLAGMIDLFKLQWAVRQTVQIHADRDAEIMFLRHQDPDCVRRSIDLRLALSVISAAARSRELQARDASTLASKRLPYLLALEVAT
jgi:hypothetical protein